MGWGDDCGGTCKRARAVDDCLVVRFGNTERKRGQMSDRAAKRRASAIPLHVKQREPVRGRCEGRRGGSKKKKQ